MSEIIKSIEKIEMERFDVKGGFQERGKTVNKILESYLNKFAVGQTIVVFSIEGLYYEMNLKTWKIKNAYRSFLTNGKHKTFKETLEMNEKQIIDLFEEKASQLEKEKMNQLKYTVQDGKIPYFAGRFVEPIATELLQVEVYKFLQSVNCTEIGTNCRIEVKADFIQSDEKGTKVKFELNEKVSLVVQQIDGTTDRFLVCKKFVEVPKVSTTENAVQAGKDLVTKK